MKLPECNCGKYPFANLPGEEWRTSKILGEDGLVSNMGRCVRIIKSRNQRLASVGRVRIPIGKVMGYRIKTGLISDNGYVKVYCCGKNYYLHRVVALAFIPNPNNYPEIDHINGIRDDNRAENLRWVNRSMNMANPIAKAKQKANAARQKLAVLQIEYKTGKTIRRWEGLNDAADYYGVEGTHITHACRSIFSDSPKIVGGYGWIYERDYDPLINYRVKYGLKDTSVVVIKNGQITNIFRSARTAGYFYKKQPSTIGALCSRDKEPIHPRGNSIKGVRLRYFKNLNVKEKTYVRENYDSLIIESEPI